MFLSNYGSEPVEGWDVWWAFDENVEVLNSFGAAVTGNNPYFATSSSSNETISPGRWVTFGFEASYEYGLNVEIPEIMGGICDNDEPPPPANNPPEVDATASVTSGPAPLTVEFDASATTDPDGDELTYSWNFGDGNNATGPIVQHTFEDGGSYNARVTVSDGEFDVTSIVPIEVTSPPADLVCNVAVVNDWGSGFQGQVDIRNDGQSVSDWVAVITFSTPVAPGNYWGPPGIQIDIRDPNEIVLTGGPLAAGQTVSTGFIGTYEEGPLQVLDCTVTAN